MGTVDIFESRRSCFVKCRWWHLKVPVKGSVQSSLDKFIHSNEPSGCFYAEEIQPIASSPSASGDIRYERSTVTISTSDDIWGKVVRNDLVSYANRIWRVESLSLQPEFKRRQFGSRKTGEGSKILVLVS